MAVSTSEAPNRASRAPKWLLMVDRVLDRVSGGISHVCTVLLAVLLLTMVVAATVQVIARYVFPTVVGGPEEIARTAMVAIVFLGMPVLARHSEHIVLDLLQEKVSSARGREFLLRLALAGELLFLTILVIITIPFLERLWLSPQESPALEIRLFWTRLPVLIGASLGALVTAGALLRRFLQTGATEYGRSTAEPMGVETLAGRELAPEVGESR